jgi:redox-sensitive bicupin YhaK (pirin superfamily)
MTTRTVALIETATNEKVGTFKIKNVLPTRNLKQIDPFLLIHHMQPFELHPGDKARIPPHPHAGFEVVTYLLDGEFFHRDSQGNNQVARGGDINWMSAGTGITHSEGPTEAFLKTEKPVIQLLQIWINLASDKKKLKASFNHFPSAGFPVIEKDGHWIKILLGEQAGNKSPIDTHSPMFLYHLKIKAGERIILPVNEMDSAAIYLMQGKIKVLNDEVKAGQLIDFNIDGDQLSFSAGEDSEMIVFGGRPIKEKVVSYGPFVMNSAEEIQQAIGDYEIGKMGKLDY